MGAANPLAAAEKTREIARSRWACNGLKIAAVTGDDVLDASRTGDYRSRRSGGRVNDLGNRIVSANAYLGAGPIVEALAGGADVVITGRHRRPGAVPGVR